MPRDYLVRVTIACVLSIDTDLTYSLVVICSLPCHERLLETAHAARAVETRRAAATELKCFVCKDGTFSPVKPYRETCIVGHAFVLKSCEQP